jgi:hypothetical protein
MKQYVSSITISVVILAVKDKAYFCPDGTPMATAVLAASGAYTDHGKTTDWTDIFVRVCGQLFGWGAVCFGVAGPNKVMFAFGVPEFKHRIGGGTDELAHVNVWFTVFNEFFATSIECIAISFLVMPLLSAYSAPQGVDGLQSKGRAVSFKDASQGVDGFQSKGEAMPPRNKDLWFASICLGVLHYVLERVFRTTMNPFVFIMHRHVTTFDDAAWIAVVLTVQCAALAFACVYCYFLLPSQRVFDHLGKS